jgi:spore germination protein YaaH
MKLRLSRGPLLSAIITVLFAVLAAPGRDTHAARPSGEPLPVRWGFYITYNPNSFTSLQANARYLNYVSPWLFNLNAAGQITGKDQPQVAALLHQVGAKSLPMLKNSPQYNDFTPLIADPAKQDAIIAQIDSLISTYSYDGITIDFEGVNAADKPLLTSFMSRLYARLHPQGKLVAIAVAAKTKDIVSGWAGAYDYPALAPVIDYMLVMAYDYHWATGTPGPIAPMDRLLDTAAYTASRVQPDKVIWGVGVYGYDWGLDTSNNWDGQHAEYRSFAESEALAATPGGQKGYDPNYQAPWVLYQRDGKTRVIWHENARSFAAKLDLVARYSFAGFGIWRLGQEDPDLWDNVLTAPVQPGACQPVDPPNPSGGRLYFPQTGHTLRGTFLSYWQSHGGLPIYGYPLTEEFTETNPTDGKPYAVQYFERNRFEFHPENRPPNDVLLGLLGVQLTRGRTFPPAADPNPGPETLFFPQVRHTLGSPFLGYWQSRGGLAQFGYPISEPVLETSQTDGQTYLVQYMERARFEYHPEFKGTAAEVLLGLLGRDVSPCR